VEHLDDMHPRGVDRRDEDSIERRLRFLKFDLSHLSSLSEHLSDNDDHDDDDDGNRLGGEAVLDKKAEELDEKNDSFVSQSVKAEENTTKRRLKKKKSNQPRAVSASDDGDLVDSDNDLDS